MGLVTKGLIAHTVLVVVGKPERAIPIQSLLGKLGARIVVASSVFEAVQSVGREMPHMIITESLVEGGNAGVLFDKLQKETLFRNIPILVLVYKKSKEELSALVGRKFSGFWVGAIQPNGFSAKVEEILYGGESASPYFVEAGKAGIKAEFELSLEATTLGRRGSFLVLKSKALLVNDSPFNCFPVDKPKSPLVLSNGFNMLSKDEVFNLVPLSRISSRACDWLGKVAGGTDDKNAAQPAKSTRKLLWFDANVERGKEFLNLVKSLGLALIGVNSLNALVGILAKKPDDIAALVINEPQLDLTGLYRQLIEPLPPANRPMLIGLGDPGNPGQKTSLGDQLKSGSSLNICYLGKFFQLGDLLLALEASLSRSEDLAQAFSARPGNAVTYSASAKLVGLDEIGGVFELGFPIAVGARINLNHARLKDLWEGRGEVKVAACKALAGVSRVWQIRFEAISAGTSKVKYFEKIAKNLETKQPLAS